MCAVRCAVWSIMCTEEHLGGGGEATQAICAGSSDARVTDYL